MRSYIWTIDLKLSSSLRRFGGVSTSYVMPKSFMLTKPNNLAGATLWIVLQRPPVNIIYGKFYISLVELFESGMNAGDFLLSIDLLKSFVCARNNGDHANPFKMPRDAHFRVGLRVADEKTEDLMEKVVANNIPVSLQRLPQKLFREAENVHFSVPDNPEAAALIRSSTASLCLDEIWASGPKANLPPFANFAKQWLNFYGKTEVTSDMVKALSELDPTAALKEKKDKREWSNWRNQELVPVIDIQLSSIEPDMISERRFIAKAFGGLKYLEALAKTDYAERRHQDMLREIVSKLLDIGIKPLQSSSIDLLLRIFNSTFVFELKSITLDNATNQCAKGLFQLGCYCDALILNGYENVRPSLLIETSGQPELDAFLLRKIAFFNLNVFFYYPHKCWPYKVSSANETLEQFLLSGTNGRKTILHAKPNARS